MRKRQLFRLLYVLGVVLVTFLLDYQPVFHIPGVAKGIVLAQDQQVLEAKPLPLEFQLPHPGYLSTYFSSYHPGIDIATGLGMSIKPIAKGKVVNAEFNFWGLGFVVEVDHGFGYKSTYAHLGKIYVKKDQAVDPNNYLGEVGLTGHTSGPHTHLEISKDGKNIDPLTILPEIRSMPQTEDFIPIQNIKISNYINFRKELKESL